MQKVLALTAATLAIAATAGAQTNFPETEPNDSKATANAVACMNPGDTITGNSISAATTGLDYYDVTVCTQTAGLKQHRLTLTSAVVGHTGTIRGLTQTAGVPTAGTDATFATSSTTTTPARFVQWYASGAAPSRISYRVTGAAATTADYVATLSSTAISPVVVPGVFNPGTITVTTVGQTTTDTEIYVYDAGFNPVPTAHNDDEGPVGPTLQSRVARTLAAGTYYAAIANYNTGNSNGDANADEDFLLGNLLDFPNALANSSTTLNLNCNCTISDGTTTTPVTLTRVGAYDIAWACFTVGTPPAFSAFCAGDGTLTDHTTPCPCANNGAAGNGCANSANAAGANLTATGSAAADNVVLNGSGMPLTVSCIYLQGDALDDVVFGDGVRCTGGALIRLRTKANVGGASSFPDSADTITLSTRGGVTPGSGARRYYQTYYRNSASAFCPPETFNVTNGWKIDW